MSDPRIEAVRDLLAELAPLSPQLDARMSRALAGLDDIGRELASHGGDNDRLQEINDAILALAARDLSRRLTLADDGGAIDGVAAGVNMMSEEIAAYISELSSTNEALRKEVFERQKAEEALRKSEEQLRHSQKMEAVGRLSGGIAHDFNNLLSVILGYSNFLLDADLDPGQRGYAEEIRRAGERAADLTRQLLAFSRQQVLEPRVVDLNRLISQMDKMIRRLVGEDIDVTSHPMPGLGWVKVDPGQIEQVVMNLVVNARDAMPDGGKISIETANVDIDETYVADHPEATPGPHVMLAVSDTGEGMDKLTQARIFEPFFTTKERGKGTGLGLSTVFGIVRQSGGTIYVYSEVGRGTSFKVYLPRTAETVETVAAAPKVAYARGTETILLVEDDQQVRVLVRGALKRLGYTVIEAPSPGEAIIRCEQHTGKLHLLLTDVVMPGMNGRRLAERLVGIRPGLKVLYMSGYTGNVIVHHGVLDAGVAFLPKPITPEALARKVREILDGK